MAVFRKDRARWREVTRVPTARSHAIVAEGTDFYDQPSPWQLISGKRFRRLEIRIRLRDPMLAAQVDSRMASFVEGSPLVLVLASPRAAKVKALGKMAGAATTRQI
jgi:hypothetical protein